MMDFKINAIIIEKRSFIILTIVGSLFLNFIPLPALSPILIVLFGLLLGIFIIAIFAHEDFNFLFNLFAIGFILRLFLSFLFYMMSFVFKGDYSPGFLFANDGWSYSRQGWQICRFAERGIRVTMDQFMTDPNMKIGHGTSGNIVPYDYFTSHVYLFTGHSPLSMFFISSLAGSIVALFVYLLARHLFGKNVARISSIFAFFWPSFIMWSTQNLKEPVIAMFLCIFLWAIFYMRRYYCPGFLLLAVLSVWILFKIGLPYLVVALGMVFLTFLFLAIWHLIKNKFITTLIIGLSIFAVFFVLRNDILSWVSKINFYSIGGYDSIFDFFNYHRSVRAYGNLQFFRNADISSFGRMLVFSPLGLLYVFFSPFPWQLGNIMQVMAVPETIIFYIMVPFTLKGIVFAYKKRFTQSAVLLFIIIGMVSVLALTEGNSGTLLRHRSIVFYLLFIFTGIGLSLKKWKIRLYT
ncbi:MAG: glycosyltransferase family 39 protein [Candidatus Gorgyraea atricola]|nr:glycosyltransferase family 39 protein [Candidatus Gorgyraea atricola]